MGLLGGVLGWRHAGGDTLFVPTARYSMAPPRQLIILEHGSNPSTDYYLTPRCAVAGAVPSTRIDMQHRQPEPDMIPAGSFVIIVRYLDSRWAAYLRQLQPQLAGIVYFMDDDLPAARRAAELPLRYRYKIHRLFHRQRGTLAALCSEVWVSTRYLAEKYIDSHPMILPPAPLQPGTAAQPLVYFYHGSASHQAELRWLRDIVAGVQQDNPRLTFIAIGDESVRRLYASLPRTLVLHPLAWDTYRDSLPAIGHHIGLAPLLPGTFNTGRSPTRFFDHTRLGAAGLYANSAPYAGFIRHRQDGLLLDHDTDAWRHAILELAASTELRTTLLGNARQRVEQIAAGLEPLLPPTA